MIQKIASAWSNTPPRASYENPITPPTTSQPQDKKKLKSHRTLTHCTWQPRTSGVQHFKAIPKAPMTNHGADKSHAAINIRIVKTLYPQLDDSTRLSLSV